MLLLQAMSLEGWSSPSLFIPTVLLVLAIFLYFHRKHPQLRLPPSPFALPIIGHLHLLGTPIHQSFHKLSSRYGPIFHLRLGSVPSIVVSSSELTKELLTSHSLTFSSRRTTLAINHVTYNAAFAFAPYGSYWKFIRKLTTTELLEPRALDTFLPLRKKEYRQFLGRLMSKSESGKAANVTEELLRLTNDIICQMVFSSGCSGTQGQAEEARTIVREVTRIFGEFNVSDFIWFCKKLDLQGIRKKYVDVHKRYDALLEKIITEREQVRRENKGRCHVAGEGDVKDLLDTMLDVLEDENPEVEVTRDHIKALVLDFFVAATDTSAITLEWAIAELTNNPMALKKARDEIEQVVGKSRLVDESDIPNLKYMDAIIKETFRLHPPIPMLIRKATKTCNISGYDIPENTLLFVNVWSIGRNPKYWENPLKFRPERFLPSADLDAGTGSEPIDIRGQHFQLLPFGTGRRGCLGIPLAMQELPTVLAALIQCFELQVVSSQKGDTVVDMTERHGLAAPRAHDLVCIPVARCNPNLID